MGCREKGEESPKSNTYLTIRIIAKNTRNPRQIKGSK